MAHIGHLIWIYTVCPIGFGTFANSLDPDKMVHNELSHLGLDCFPFLLLSFDWHTYF